MIEIKKYSPEEERANVFSHLLAALISIYGILILIENSKNAVQAVSTIIFGISLFLLFMSSTLYHAMTKEKVKKIFQIIDHSVIYILIAGTYTPALVLTLKFPLSIVMLSIIWGLAITSIMVSYIKIKSKYLSTGLYLLMGWISIFFVYNVWMTSHLSVWLLLIGGIFYSLGCIFYLMKFRYTHLFWHLFVIAGAAMHYFAILELLKMAN